MGYTDIEVESGSDYVKLIAGEVVTFNILSQEPKKAVIHWVNRKKEACKGKGCENCEMGDKPKQRWTAEVWERKDKKVKKLEFGSMIAGQFKAIAEMLAENHQTIHDVDIRIKTTGSGLETDYNVLNIPKTGDIPKEVLENYAVPF